MRKSRNCNDGFSLTECLLAIGTIAVGMLFIAGVFPVGIHFNTVASERTIAAIVADEAFAKIRLYGVADFNSWPVPPAAACADYRNVSFVVVNPEEFSYPSDPNINISRKQFYWSALCRRADYDPNSRLVQVTVFVCRKIGSGTTYHDQGLPGNMPVPALVGIPAVPGPDTLQIEAGKEEFINDGYTIVDNQTGQIYRVLERDSIMPDRIILDRPWLGGPMGAAVWVIPPPIGGGRGPCIAIYQRVIRF